MKSTNVDVSQRDLPMTNDNPKETEQITLKRGTTSMCSDDVDPLEDPIEVAMLKLEVDRMPLTPEQMKQLFEQIKLEEGTSHSTEEQCSRVRTVIEKYSFLFAMNSLDLGRTDLVKHHIQLDNYTPIKDRYHRIPPHQYEEVQKHLKEMLSESCLGELHLDWCIIYLDDIIIFLKDRDDHITRLEGVSKKLAKAGLKLKPSKC